MAKRTKSKTTVSKKAAAKKLKKKVEPNKVRKKSSQKSVAKSKTKVTKKAKVKETKKEDDKPSSDATTRTVSVQSPTVVQGTLAVEANGQATIQEQIRSLAYSNWEQAGYPVSDGVRFWEAAEREVRLKQSLGFENLFSNLPDLLTDELVERILQNELIHIEKIVSYGKASPKDFWYDQNWDEWVLVVTGAARLRFEDESEMLELSPGDYVNIRAQQRHRVEWTTPDEPTIWLAVHYNGSNHVNKVERI